MNNDRKTETLAKSAIITNLNKNNEQKPNNEAGGRVMRAGIGK